MESIFSDQNSKLHIIIRSTNPSAAAVGEEQSSLADPETTDIMTAEKQATSAEGNSTAATDSPSPEAKAQRDQDQESQKIAVLAVVGKLLSSLSIPGAAGRAIFKSTLAPRGLAIHARGGNDPDLEYDSFPDGFADRIPWDDTSGKKMVEGFDGEPTVMIDADVAMVWAPYFFTFDGVLSHVGTDIVTLVRRDWCGKGKGQGQDGKEWLIVSATDNARPPTDEDRRRLGVRS